MSGRSRKTILLTLRIPKDTFGILKRRARRNNITVYEYLTTRIVYDTHRKHIAGHEIPNKKEDGHAQNFTTDTLKKENTIEG